MSGSVTHGSRENVSDIPGACATHNFTYLARGPWRGNDKSLSEWRQRVLVDIFISKLQGVNRVKQKYGTRYIAAVIWLQYFCKQTYKMWNPWPAADIIYWHICASLGFDVLIHIHFHEWVIVIFGLKDTLRTAKQIMEQTYPTFQWYSICVVYSICHHNGISVPCWFCVHIW